MSAHELFPEFDEGTRMTGLGQTWIVKSALGMGRCAKVYHITTLDGSVEAAAKVFRKEDKYKLVFIKEIRNLDGITGHNQVVSVYGTFTHKGHPCLIYELLDFSLKELHFRVDHLDALIFNNNNNKTDHVTQSTSKSTNKKSSSTHSANQEPQGLSLYLIQSLFHNLLKCLHHIHNRGWVHADLKPANIMWSAQEGCWKAVDFGHSFEENRQDLSQIQSMSYQSPEARLWNNFISSHEYQHNRSVQSDVLQEECTSAVDVWSLGAIVAGVFLWRKLYGPDDVTPGGCKQCQTDSEFEKCECEPLIDSCIKARPSDLLPKYRKVLADLRDLLKQMLQCDPVKRPSTEGCLQHRFFSHKLTPEYRDLIFLPTRILRLVNVTEGMDLDDSEEYHDVCRDIQEECENFGPIQTIQVPKEGSGKGKAFVEFQSSKDCIKARSTLSGQTFSGQTVIATFFPHQDFKEKSFY